jgi:hypothetical protein
MTDAHRHRLIVATNMVRKSGIASLLCALVLAGCQLYWRKPDANLAAFAADHQMCVAKAGTDVGAGQVLVNLDVYRACLKVHGWQRATGGTYANPPGFYRGLENEGPIRPDAIPTQVGNTEGSDAATTSGRRMACWRSHIEGRADWRDRWADYQKCLAE